MSGSEAISSPKCVTLNRFAAACMFLSVLRLRERKLKYRSGLLGAKNVTSRFDVSSGHSSKVASSMSGHALGLVALAKSHQ
jgi:hypothetical protein